MTTKLSDRSKLIDSLARSKWIDDLSDEEMKVLKKSHELDEKLKNEKYGRPIKIGLLDDLK